MPLHAGSRLGPYEILSALGAGGMGEVYKARDTRLDRTVAIKILSQALAADSQFRDRFDREARTISQLDHPHICALYDVGEAQVPARAGSSHEPSAISHDVVRFLVMQYLEGETLEQRLKNGALPIQDALAIAIQIADALVTAHKAGIVHRDLKPANIFLVRRGRASALPEAKLLDFGLAKATAPVGSVAGLSMSPTTPPGLTAQGTILGTFQYMAPEQLQGQEADARTDIFAFGGVVYEMVTGKKAFEGRSQASLIGAILKDEPPPVSSVQPLAPASLDYIVTTCLAKDPDDRWQTARDLLRELKRVAAGATPAVVGAVRPKARASRFGFALAGALGVALVAALAVVARHLREAPPREDAIQFTIAAPENSAFGRTTIGTEAVPQLAVSPDGRQVVFVAISQGRSALWLRSLETISSRLLPDTELAAYPFWSPDSRFIGFFAGGKLKKILVSGGPPVALCEALSGLGGTWNRDNVIVFAPGTRGALQRVSAAGGVPTPVSALDDARAETTHRWPHFLPDGRHFLYWAGALVVAGTPQRPPEVKVGSLDSREVTSVLTAESAAAYGSGHLFFWRDGTLMVQPFDATTRRATGDPFPVAERVARSASRYVSFSVSPSGVLVYAQASAQSTMRRLTWKDRAGQSLGPVGEPGNYGSVALAPDSRRVAVSLTTGTPANTDIWVIDLARAVTSRLTLGPGDATAPVWSPDGGQIAFGAVRAGAVNPRLYRKPSSGSGQEEPLVASEAANSANYPSDWSKDGKSIVYTRIGAANRDVVWVLPLSGDRKPFQFLQAPFNEAFGAFAPDGHWIAYSSNEAGEPQVYVQPFPATGAKYQVSRSGGTQPLWRVDGKELFFLALDSSVMAVSISTTSGLRASIPQKLFDSGAQAPFMNQSVAGNARQYAVTNDGQRFLVIVPEQQQANQTSLTIVVNWPATVRR